MAAAIAALEELGGKTEEPGTPPARGQKFDAYRKLEELGAALEAGLKHAAQSAGVPVQFNRCGSMFCAYFTDKPVHNLADAMHCDRPRFARFFHGMLAEG